MDEKLLLRFVNGGAPMKVEAFKPEEGIVFDNPRDASPLNMAFGLQSLLPGRLEPVRQRHGWQNREFRLDAMACDGGVLFSGFRGDREGLPFGAYDITVEVESYRFKNAQRRVVLREGQQAEVVFEVKTDRRRVRLLDNFDPATKTLVDASLIDGEALSAWLENLTPRGARKACLLNILTKLAAPATPQRPVQKLTHRFGSIHFADVDRVYAIADPVLKADLDGFVDRKSWVFEGKPAAAIHRKVVTDTLNRFPELQGKTESDFELLSYRQGGRNCLQVVLAIPTFPHPKLYTDIDIDLGNPLWDLEGLFVHLGEVLDSGQTDHFALHKRLNKGETKDFVFYKVVRG